MDKKYNELEPKEKGGVIYAYLTLCEMFELNRDTKESMLGYLAFFRKRGVAHYPGENVVVVAKELLGVCKRLATVDALTSEHVHDVLTGLSICNNTRFKDMFSQLARSSDLGNVDILPTIHCSDPPGIQVDKILEKAVSMYSMFCKSNKWNIAKKGGGGHRTYKASNEPEFKEGCCWNCGKKGCRPKKCDKPEDKARQQRCYEAWKKAGRPGSKPGSGNTSNKTTPPVASPSSTAERQRKAWASSGIHMHNGVLMANCKTCGGLVDSHTTKTHAEWAKDPVNFWLPDNHAFMIAKAKLSGGNSGGGQPPPVATPPVAPPPAAKANILSEAKIAEYERTSTDPNAGSIAEAMRAMMLN